MSRPVEELDWRIRKVHGSWCVQHHTEHVVVKDGEPTTFLLWEFVTARLTHAEAIEALDFLLRLEKEYDLNDHHLEACS
jgi:hypothetical protein